MSRDIKRATPFLQWFWPVFQQAVKDELNLDIFLIDVDRDWKVQRAYYAQGRDTLSVVNHLRKCAGLPIITTAQNKRKITWTMKSKHITNLENESPYDDYSRAIDIGLKTKDGRYAGDAQVDLNGDKKADYKQIGEIGMRIGGSRIQWGGLWSSPDYPHYQES
jgi:hypothetical protein